MFEDKPSDMSVQITPADQEALGLNKKPMSQNKSFSQNNHLENSHRNNTARETKD